MTRQYFGTDGIRGEANAFPMTADVALKVAMASAAVLRERRDPQKITDRVIIGKDTRLSGYMFEEAMCAGFVAMGLDVILTGPIPTPGVSFLTRSLRADLGVMISASHNPYQDNGIKLFGADGYKLDDALELEIEALIDRDLSDKRAASSKLGKAARLDDALGRYAEALKASFPKRKRFSGIKVVVDCAHGAAYKLAPQLLWELECEVVAIGTAPNGRNINDGCGATKPEALSKAVLEHGADVGFALDGDADRLIVVDETGRVVDGDQVMGAIALYLKEQDSLPGDTLVSTVMSNLGLERALAAKGIALHRTQVGDRYVMEAMRAGNFSLGGEQSGHIIMSEYARTGDGLLTALQVLNVLKHYQRKTSEVFRVFEPVPQILKNVRLASSEQKTLHETQGFMDELQRVEQELNGRGRVLVRPSGTEPLLRVMVEGDELEQVDAAATHLCDVIEKLAAAG